MGDWRWRRQGLAAAVSSDDDTAAAVVSVEGEPELPVTITGTNGPVTEGETIFVDATIENGGSGTLAQTIIAGLSDPTYDETATDAAADTARLVLDPGESTDLTLAVDAAAYRTGTAPTYDRELWVGSKIDSAATTVTADVENVGGIDAAELLEET